MDIVYRCKDCKQPWCIDCFEDTDEKDLNICCKSSNVVEETGEEENTEEEEDNAVTIQKKERCAGGDCVLRLICVKCGHFMD